MVNIKPPSQPAIKHGRLRKGRCNQASETVAQKENRGLGTDDTARTFQTSCARSEAQGPERRAAKAHGTQARETARGTKRAQPESGKSQESAETKVVRADVGSFRETRARNKPIRCAWNIMPLLLVSMPMACTSYIIELNA
jgi:hypothetical protein